MPDAIIVGAGGFGRELCQLISASGWTVAGFVDAADLADTASLARPLLGDDAALPQLRRQCGNAFIAVGDLERRRRICARLEELDFTLPVFVHPSAYAADTALLAQGVIVYPNASLLHRVSLGRCVLVNANASIGHDTVCGDFTTINPNSAISGNVTIGSEVLIGAGATIIERLKIADHAVVGAGSVVIRAITAPGTYVGNPSRKVS